MFQTVKKLRKKRVARYIFWGMQAGAVNMGTYYLLRFFVPAMSYTAANITSVMLATLYAYFTNSKFVFRSTSRGFHERLPEFLKFVSTRFSTVAVEVGGVWLLCEGFHIMDYLGKILIQFVVFAMNYSFGKNVVFRHCQIPVQNQVQRKIKSI